MHPARRRAVLRDALGVGVAVGTSGVSFGAVAKAGGFSVLQACALSLLMFSGASQFALVTTLAGGGSAASGVATALGLGVRNGLYGLRLAPMLGLRGVRRLLGAQVVIDESTAMALSRPDPAESRLAMLATGSAVFVFWNLATLVGALGADALGDPRRAGLDVAADAAFLALVVPRLTGRRERGVAVLAVILVLLAVPWAPAGVPVLLGGLAVLPFSRPASPP
jgi:predicted branched-subunit amino acid permease